VLVQFLDHPADHGREQAGGSAEQQADPRVLSHEVSFRYHFDGLSLPSGWVRWNREIRVIRPHSSSPRLIPSSPRRGSAWESPPRRGRHPVLRLAWRAVHPGPPAAGPVGAGGPSCLPGRAVRPRGCLHTRLDEATRRGPRHRAIPVPPPGRPVRIMVTKAQFSDRTAVPSGARWISRSWPATPLPG
jgi:hypothetical protein